MSTQAPEQSYLSRKAIEALRQADSRFAAMSNADLLRAFDEQDNLSAFNERRFGDGRMSAQVRDAVARRIQADMNEIAAVLAGRGIGL